MKIGEKIRAERKRLGLTQSAVAGDYITRNMLSAIEAGKVSPSLDTLRYLSETLDLPTGYLIDDNADLFPYKKERFIQSIRNSYTQKKYEACLSAIKKIGELDEELRYILVCSSFYLGKAMAIAGNLRRAEQCFSLCLEHINQCIYPTDQFRSLIPLYSAITKNVQSPLLEMDTKAFSSHIFTSYDYEFYQYLHQDYDYPYTNEVFKLHAEAKRLMRVRKYHEAIVILHKLEDMKTPQQYNSCVVLGVYTDLEISYKELVNFEQAYRYANKRMLLLEGFRT